MIPHLLLVLYCYCEALIEISEVLEKWNLRAGLRSHVIFYLQAKISSMDADAFLNLATNCSACSKVARCLYN